MDNPPKPVNPYGACQAVAEIINSTPQSWEGLYIHDVQPGQEKTRVNFYLKAGGEIREISAHFINYLGRIAEVMVVPKTRDGLLAAKAIAALLPQQYPGATCWINRSCCWPE